MKKNNIKVLLLLHLLLMVYSISDVCSKKAAAVPFLSFPFIFYYGIIVALLGLYAIGWQQIIKRLPLTSAYANRAITIVWGIIWGLVFFHEQITIGKILGAALVIIGVVLFAKADQEEKYE